ncbi:Uncharacterised protein [Mycobacteroides abscessus]|nr:Uncharacterised protein [Mycobacteroides abscessus]
MKKSMTGPSSNEGELTTSMTTADPVSASTSPSPVNTFAPDDNDAATTSCPSAMSNDTTREPIWPVAPTTVIFIV